MTRDAIWDPLNVRAEMLRRIRIQDREATRPERMRRQCEEFRRIAKRARGNEIESAFEVELLGPPGFDSDIPKAHLSGGDL